MADRFGATMIEQYLFADDGNVPNNPRLPLIVYRGALKTNGDNAWFGWPNSPEVETDITAWFDAKSLDEEKVAMRKLNKDALDFVVYAPTGFFLTYQAWRKNVEGVVKGPLPFAWGVSKQA